MKSTYASLLKRKILGEFLVKRGGVRTNWKCRYFLLTGDHLHYFEPQIVPLLPISSLFPPFSFSLFFSFFLSLNHISFFQALEIKR